MIYSGGRCIGKDFGVICFRFNFMNYFILGYNYIIKLVYMLFKFLENWMIGKIKIMDLIDFGIFMVM